MLVAVGEAAANAIEHPHEPRRGASASRRGHGEYLIVRVSDSGGGASRISRRGRGRGLPFMASLMSDVLVRKGDPGTEMTCVAACVRASPRIRCRESV